MAPRKTQKKFSQAVARNWGGTSSVVDTLCNIIAAFGTIMTFWGVGSAVGNSSRNSTWVISIAEFPFAARIVFFVIVSAALGWSLGSLILAITRSLKEAWVVVSYFCGIVWAGLLVMSAELLADSQTKTGLPQLELLCLLGVGIVLWLLTFQFRATAHPGTVYSVRARAGGVFAFAMGTFVILLLTEFKV